MATDAETEPLKEPQRFSMPNILALIESFEFSRKRSRLRDAKKKL